MPFYQQNLSLFSCNFYMWFFSSKHWLILWFFFMFFSLSISWRKNGWKNYSIVRSNSCGYRGISSFGISKKKFQHSSIGWGKKIMKILAPQCGKNKNSLIWEIFSWNWILTWMIIKLISRKFCEISESRIPWFLHCVLWW